MKITACCSGRISDFCMGEQWRKPGVLTQASKSRLSESIKYFTQVLLRMIAKATSLHLICYFIILKVTILQFMILEF